MRTDLHLAALLASSLIALAGCADGPAPPAAASTPAAIVAAADRSPGDRAMDARRKPAELLGFIGVRSGMIALDVAAGGGYTAELLARAIGPAGAVYGQSAPRKAAAGAAAASAPPRTSATALAERERRLEAGHVAAAQLIAVQQRFEDPVPAALADGGLDLVTLVFNYHDFGHMGVDRAQLNRALYKALKPGGVYVVVDHAGRPGTGISESGTLHRVEESFVRAEVEAAGFKLVAAGDFLRNPADPRDATTPPVPEDGFALKFVRP
ncbi:MAG: class I SAM-dependent methyltransferase [Burkholderiales bacterium]|nr:class I SAM-dependent methyltransferase [Burkholderiales bacterium]